MKKLLLVLPILLIGSFAFAQKYPTGLKEIKEGDKSLEILKSIPVFKPSAQRLKAARAGEQTVRSVDNSISDYFPDIILQRGGSCVFASSIGYMYAYEMNKILNRPASATNELNYQYIYALGNDGEDIGGFVWDAIWPIEDNGVPFIKDHIPAGIYEWISGSDKYINGMVNGVRYFYRYQFFDKEENFLPDAFEVIKQYLVDDGVTGHGRVFQFSAYADPLDHTPYNGPSETGYEAIIPKFGTDGMHSMIIVGFDDDVEWDYNEDGVISDDEKGAFLCVNSWGTGWGDNGRFYAPYKTFRDLFQGEGGTGNGPLGGVIGKGCFCVVPKVNDVTTVIKARVKHSSRNDIKFKVGIAASASATEPDVQREVYVMNHGGGDNKMSGGTSSEIEFALNVTDLLDSISNTETPKFFIDIVSGKDPYSDNEDKLDIGDVGTGDLTFCSLIKKSDVTNVYLGRIADSYISNGNTTRGVILEKKPDVADGINTDVDYMRNGTNLELYINAASKGYIIIDFVSESGEVVKTVTSEVVEPGGTVYTVDLLKMSQTAVAIRVSVDNKLIYKRIK